MTPRNAAQNQALRDATRKRILEAALRLFSREGYASTTIRAIAQEAGIAQGLLYSHFKGKEELLKALFRHSMDEVRGTFAAAAAADPRPPLERLVGAAVAALRRDLDFWRLSYGVRMQESVVRALGPDFKAWTRDILTGLEGHFRASGSLQPAVDAALFFAALDGVCQHFALDPARYPFDAVAGALIGRFAPAAPAATRPAARGKKGTLRVRNRS